MVHIESTQMFAVLGVFCTVVLSVVGYMIVRAVTKVDGSLTKLTTKVDALSAQDTSILVQLEGLKVQSQTNQSRILQLEIAVYRPNDIARGHTP